MSAMSSARLPGILGPGRRHWSTNGSRHEAINRCATVEWVVERPIENTVDPDEPTAGRVVLKGVHEDRNPTSACGGRRFQLENGAEMFPALNGCSVKVAQLVVEESVGGISSVTTAGEIVDGGFLPWIASGGRW